MKHISVLFWITLLFFSCKKEEKALFTIPIRNLSFTVDATIQPPLTYYLPINNVATNTQAIFTGQGVDPADIDAIVPRNARLFVVFANDDLDFLDAVSIRLCPLGNNVENCGKEAFYRDPVPFNTGSEIDLIPSNIGDLSDILLEDNINVQVKLERLDGFPNGTFDVILDMEFEVR